MHVPVWRGTASQPSEKPSTPHKLSPPRLDGLVSRSRLLKQMERSGGIVTIVGPPVSGKTCLAVSWTNLAWITERAVDVFWYQINDADGDIATFFQLIEDAASQRPPPNLKLPLSQCRGRPRWIHSRLAQSAFPREAATTHCLYL